MRRAFPIVAVSTLMLAVAVLLPAGSGWAQAKPELTVALSSLSTETLDPALGGHIVKYYLSLIFDYLVGSTPDGQPSPAADSPYAGRTPQTTSAGRSTSARVSSLITVTT